MKNIARRHHVVPQGYLAGFTDDGTPAGVLTVFDRVSESVFPAKPRNVATKRDFNRVDLDGLPPDAVEQALGELEGKAIRAIRRLQERGGCLTDEELSDIVNLMALLVARNPQSRRAMNAAREQTGRISLGMLASDRGMYEHHVAKAKSEGFIPGDDAVPFEQAAAFIESDQYRIDVSTTESILGELRVFESVFETLASRWWSLVIADPDAPDLVTCDHPVTVVSKDQSRRGPIGYGLPGTEVSFPLGPRHALVGVLENPLRPQFTARPTEVAALNSRTVHHADRQVYARSPHAVILQRGGMADFNVCAEP
ncbi:MAG: DUF4238 domain-containing protein [Acidobacteria bacterium]|nr:DUF4238 domain-containing protein [Acidobacteriota bacterium]